MSNNVNHDSGRKSRSKKTHHTLYSLSRNKHHETKIMQQKKQIASFKASTCICHIYRVTTTRLKAQIWSIWSLHVVLDVVQQTNFAKNWHWQSVGQAWWDLWVWDLPAKTRRLIRFGECFPNITWFHDKKMITTVSNPWGLMISNTH